MCPGGRGAQGHSSSLLGSPGSVPWGCCSRAPARLPTGATKYMPRSLPPPEGVQRDFSQRLKTEAQPSLQGMACPLSSARPTGDVFCSFPHGLIGLFLPRVFPCDSLALAWTQERAAPPGRASAPAFLHDWVKRLGDSGQEQRLSLCSSVFVYPKFPKQKVKCKPTLYNCQ